MKKLKLFSIILQEAVEISCDGNYKDALKVLNNNNCSLSYSTIRKYKDNQTLPTFEKAKEIITILKHPIKDNDLLECLAYSRKWLETNDNKTEYLTTAIRINPNWLGLSLNELNNLIDIRCKELFSDDNKKIGAYIYYLIKKDLEENDLLKYTK